MSRLWTALWMRVARPRVRWRRFSSSRVGKRGLWGAQQTLTVGVGGDLPGLPNGDRMGNDLAVSPPNSLVLYVVFLAIYFSLPLFETLAYGLIWGRRPLVLLLPATPKPRVSTLLGAGEPAGRSLPSRSPNRLRLRDVASASLRR